MTTSAPEQRQNPIFVLSPLAVHVECDGSSLCITLADGRELTTSLAWFPRLLGATDAQRAWWELIGGGEGVHWPEVDEDISVASLLGLPSD
jgi:hypothetical protein